MMKIRFMMGSGLGMMSLCKNTGVSDEVFM